MVNNECVGVPRAIIHARDLSTVEKLALMFLFDYEDECGSYGRPFSVPIEKLAAQLRLTPRRTRAIYRQLAARNLIRIQHKRGRGHHNMYVLPAWYDLSEEGKLIPIWENSPEDGERNRGRKISPPARKNQQRPEGTSAGSNR